MTIEELADFGALRQLGHALWQEGSARGAAVLVGAGFSRNAVRTGADTPEPPLWSTLVRLLAEGLYKDSNSRRYDPLRLAEEYRVNYGQAALDEIVRTSVCDQAWEPGAVHKDLLDLPWADVLTTNWDTLLERTPTNRRRAFVRTTADLAHGSEARIIKLHGTVGVSERFIFAEEDYRTYPTRYAAFVNTARQIFIEIELCLLGFSGDDPNFLKWSGWVRDHLGESARRIYLIGVLDLLPPKRKFLESRNIAPIDLGALATVGTRDEREASATAQVLRFLANARPKAAYEWRPADHAAYSFMPKTDQEIQRQFKDVAYASSLLDQAARIWREDRRNYPAWLVCPADVRRKLSSHSNVVRWQRTKAINALPSERCAEILYEIVWRSTTAFEPFDTKLVESLAPLADPARPCSLNKRQQLEIALALLRFARLQENDDDFAHWNAVLEANGEFDADLRAQASYQRCLRSRDLLDLAALAIELEKVAGQDPVWLLRRAALRCELGQFTEANALIAEAYSKLLERRRKDYNSLWVRSRLAWAEWLHSAARHDWSIPPPSPWASEFRESLCDPQIELERISDEAAQSLRRQQEDDIAAIPLFEAGHYKEPPKHASLRDGVTSTPLGALNNIIETAGLPVQLNYFDMLGQAKSDAAVLEFEPSFGWYSWLLRTRHDPFDRVFDRYFGRVAIAQLPESVALNLAERVAAALAYWRESLKVPAHRYASDRMFAVGRLRLFIEALARLTPRLDSDRARSCFELALGIARDAPVHPWLIDHIGNLARYSAQATAPTARSGLVLIALEWPLSGESGWRDGPWPWPNPIDSLFDAQCVRPESDTTWNHRVQQLLGAIRTGGVDRKEASLRLYYLARKGAFANSDAIRPGIPI